MLYKLQTKAVHIITFSRLMSHTSQVFETLRVLPLHTMYLHSVMLFMYKYFNGLLPEFAYFQKQVFNVIVIFIAILLGNVNNYMFLSVKLALCTRPSDMQVCVYLWKVISTKIKGNCTVGAFNMFKSELRT